MRMEREQVKELFRAHVQLVLTIRDMIKEAKQIPSGDLYAIINAKVASYDLNYHNHVIETLIEAGVVDQSNYLLIWIGK